MDGSLVIESLDSLWFFDNVLLSSTIKPMAQASDGLTKEDPPKPAGPNVQSQQIESPYADLVSPRCPKCGEVAAELANDYVQPISIEEVDVCLKITMKEERNSKRKKRRTGKRKILGELDMGFDGSCYYYKKYCGRNFGMLDGGTSGYGMIGSQQLPLKMLLPPLNDGMAMKEHLKSWAYAVACTVK